MPIYDGMETKDLLVNLLDECDSFSVAVAWITKNDVFDALKKNIAKAKALIVGVDFYQTDPKVLRWLKDNAPAKTYVADKAKGVFHPKVYVFWPPRGSAVIGSANLTRSAFDDNDECCVKVKLTSRNEKKLESQLMLWQSKSTPIGAFNLDEYASLARTRGREIRFFAQKRSAATAFAIHPDLLNYSFEEFFDICDSDKYHSLDDRLVLIDFVQSFTCNQTEFCFVGGIEPPSLGRFASVTPPSYGYFGGMEMDKTFYRELRDPASWQGIHQLYQSIPATGPVTYSQFEQFVDDLTNVLNSSKNSIPHYQNHLACATRLLSMRRPDHFYCQNEKNKKYFGKDLKIISHNQINPNQMNSPNGYWRAAEMIRLSPWGQSKPKAKWTPRMKACWNARIAMIDSLYYEP